MSAPFIGEIKMFGGNFAPRNFALCNGQLLAITQNTALFSILGTTYGGNGINTFALPDLQGRVPMHWGNSASGAGNYVLGEVGGVQSTTLTSQQLPAHTHGLNASSAAANSLSPAGTFMAAVDGHDPVYAQGASNAQMAPGSIAVAGNSQPVSLLQPYLTVTFIIALNGIFPSRN
jgi:microcystin-dependent protein